MNAPRGCDASRGHVIETVKYPVMATRRMSVPNIRIRRDRAAEQHHPLQPSLGPNAGLPGSYALCPSPWRSRRFADHCA